MKQKFYEKGEIIFNNGESMDNSISIVSKGEVELLYKVDNKEFRMHLLNQGCYIGGYQIHGRYHHMYTARTLSKTTIHIISKESIDHLVKEFPDFKKRIVKTVDYIEKTADPIVSFGYYRDRTANVTVKDILRLSIGRIICIKRELNRIKINRNMDSLLNDIQTNSKLMKQLTVNKDFPSEIYGLLTSLSNRVDKRFQTLYERIKKIESINLISRMSDKDGSSKILPPIKTSNSSAKESKKKITRKDDIRSPQNQRKSPKVQAKAPEATNDASPFNVPNLTPTQNQDRKSKIKSMFYNKDQDENHEISREEDRDSAEIASFKHRIHEDKQKTDY